MTKRRAELARDEIDKMIVRELDTIQRKRRRVRHLRVARAALAREAR